MCEGDGPAPLAPHPLIMSCIDRGNVYASMHFIDASMHEGYPRLGQSARQAHSSAGHYILHKAVQIRASCLHSCLFTLLLGGPALGLSANAGRAPRFRLTQQEDVPQTTPPPH